MSAGELTSNIVIRQSVESYYPLYVQQDIPDEVNLEDESPLYCQSDYNR